MRRSARVQHECGFYNEMPEAEDADTSDESESDDDLFLVGPVDETAVRLCVFFMHFYLQIVRYLQIVHTQLDNFACTTFTIIHACMQG